MTKKNITIIIPAMNEESTIESLLASLQNTLQDINDSYEIIVVDDGSTDNTSAIAGNVPGIKVIRNPYNKGNGASVKTGIQEANGEKLVVIDADGQHDPKHILEMIQLLDEYDLVVGARDTFGVGRRGFGNTLVSKIATYISGITVPDLTSGFRAFKKDKVLEFIHLFPNGFSLPSTSTLAFATSGYNIRFIPIKAHVRQGGKSSIKVFRDGMKFLILIVRMVSLFKPLKVFVPMSGIMILMGFLWSLKTIMHASALTPTGTMLFLGGIFIFMFGLLADHLAETRISIGKINKLLMKKLSDDKD